MSASELALQFVREKVADFDLERTQVVGGRVTVRRAVPQLLEPAHA